MQCRRVRGFLACALLAAPAIGTAQGAAPIDKILVATPTASSYGAHLLHLTEEPHMAGTPRNDALADYVRDRFLEYGLDEVSFHDTPALLAYPRSATLEIVKPKAQQLDLSEAPYEGDKDSRLYDDPSQVA